MRAKVIFLVLCFFISNQLFSHDPNKAFFKVSNVENGYKIEAEFPWTLRNGLIKFNSDLINATERSQFEVSLHDYISQNLKLVDEKGEPMKLEYVKEVSHSGHSHQNNYEFLFIGKRLKNITNTIQFSLYPNQINYHELLLEGHELVYNTSASAPSFELNFQKNKPIVLASKRNICITALLFSIIGLSAFFYKKQ